MQIVYKLEVSKQDLTLKASHLILSGFKILRLTKKCL